MCVWMSVVTVRWFMCFSAEFVISLAEKNPSIDEFKSVLAKNGADFTVRIFKVSSVQKCVPSILCVVILHLEF